MPKIESIERLVNSRNGNPRYQIVFSDVQGDGKVATTAPDHAFASFVGNEGMREGDDVTVTYDGRGRINHMEPNGA